MFGHIRKHLGIHIVFILMKVGDFRIYLTKNVNIYHEIPGITNFADISPSYDGFRLAYGGPNEESYIFCWQNGRLLGITKKMESLSKGSLLMSIFKKEI